jgi:hypothetical protein
MKFGLFAAAVAACSLAKPVSGEGCGWAVHVEGPTNIALETKRVIHAEHSEYIEHVDFVFAFEEHDDHDDHRRMVRTLMGRRSSCREGDFVPFHF